PLLQHAAFTRPEGGGLAGEQRESGGDTARLLVLAEAHELHAGLEVVEALIEAASADVAARAGHMGAIGGAGHRVGIQRAPEPDERRAGREREQQQQPEAPVAALGSGSDRLGSCHWNSACAWTARHADAPPAPY